MGSVSSKGHRHSYGGLTSYNLERLAPGNTSKKARVVVPVNDECPTIRSSMELKRALSESSIMKQFQYYCSLRGQEELLSFYCASQNVRNSYKNHNMEESILEFESLVNKYAKDTTHVPIQSLLNYLDSSGHLDKNRYHEAMIALRSAEYQILAVLQSNSWSQFVDVELSVNDEVNGNVEDVPVENDLALPSISRENSAQSEKFLFSYSSKFSICSTLGGTSCSSLVHC